MAESASQDSWTLGGGSPSPAMDHESSNQDSWTLAKSTESKTFKKTIEVVTATGSGSAEKLKEVMEDQAAMEARQAEMRQVHVATLDEVVSVNSFFTAAVFIGLSFNSTQTTGLDSSCMPSQEIAKHLVVSEVLAFSCFLFSTLIAQGLKLQMTLSSLKFPHFVHLHHTETAKSPLAPSPRRPRLLRPFTTHKHAHGHVPIYAHHINPRLLRFGMILSAIGSIVGTIFLLIAMINVVQIRLGVIGCSSPWPKRAIYPLVTLVSIGVITFISPVLYTVISYK
eukprot:c22173_g1_i1 orf=485-1327(+)